MTDAVQDVGDSTETAPKLEVFIATLARERGRVTAMVDKTSFKSRVGRFWRQQGNGAGLPVRLTLAALIWWILMDGAWSDMLPGVPVILLVALIPPYLGHASPWRWSFPALLRLVPVFLWFSVWSGVQIAFLALSRLRLVTPEVVEFSWRLPPGPARLFLAGIINLVPGTLSLQIREEALNIHFLYDARGNMSSVLVLEEMVAALFRVPLSEVSQ
ncbi:Na+/H+ antiporter subunit E [Desulfobulbus alkaliphilus]|uniref:Na+/H+ antiporter subunit E n=1 Tax=Desulfobulbus alkaliphilus TaxID=869814 RepID=UPI001964F010|nr:Na+/H+ antiporter subunit E [Desulfobulbus alkaliphilus]MBM9537121.1 Na+/H+ antiporter subunit E [Desulfobulbus alkaliphilus]